MKDWNWDEMAGHEEVGYKPKIVGFVESFEKKYADDLPKERLLGAASMAVALFLFGPLSESELPMYAACIKRRVEDYRESLH
jgi:hypothetical protein